MIICKDCGNKNPNGTTFCESCGTFLEWGGESVLTGGFAAIPSPDAPVEGATPLAPAEAAAPPAAPSAATEEPGGAAFQAQRLPVIADPDDDAAPGATPLAPAVPAAASPAPAAAAPQTPAAPDEPKAPGPSRPGTQVLRAMRMKARPPAPPKPAAPAGPVARAPAEEQARRPPKPPSSEAPRPQGNPGDVYCSACGTPNDPSRNYCRSCGNQLSGAAAEPVAVGGTRAPWYRRIVGGGKAAGTVVPAGTRPGAAGAASGGRKLKSGGVGAINSGAHLFRKFFQVVAILGALGIAVVAIGPWRTEAKDKVRGWVDDARRVVQPHYSKVTPSKITASTALKADPPQNAFDGIIETFWAEGAHGDGTGQSITVSFAKPTDLSRAGFTLGDQKAPQNFATRPVPRTLELVFYDKDGAVVKREQVSLEQTPKFQKRDADAKGVARLVITIRSTYPPVKGTKSSAAISEIELFTKD